jgi:hypothetical protein
LRGRGKAGRTAGEGGAGGESDFARSNNLASLSKYEAMGGADTEVPSSRVLVRSQVKLAEAQRERKKPVSETSESDQWRSLQHLRRPRAG